MSTESKPAEAVVPEVKDVANANSESETATTPSDTDVAEHPTDTMPTHDSSNANASVEEASAETPMTESPVAETGEAEARDASGPQNVEAAVADKAVDELATQASDAPLEADDAFSSAPRRSKAKELEKPDVPADHFVVRTKPDTIATETPDAAERQATKSPRTNEASSEDANATAKCKSPGRISRSIQRLRKNWKLPVACAASLAFGFCGTLLLPKAEAPVQVVANSAERPRYVAATGHRHEPIAPLAPFDGLKPQIVELGRKLFHDPGLSGNGRIACTNCHNPATGGSIDPTLADLPVSDGYRDPPSILNSALNLAQFWDGSARTIDEQLDAAIVDADKMNSDWQRVITYIEKNSIYAAAFQQHLGGAPTSERVKEAFMAYERSLITLDSPFDRWLGGSENALNSDQFGGYFAFTKLGCINCHQGPGVGGGMFQKLGSVVEYYSDERPAGPGDVGRYAVTQNESDRHVFRVPSLRNVEYTAPYFHDGSVATLDDAVRRMIVHQVGGQPNSEEVRRIVEFLKTLSGKLPQPSVE